MEVEEGISEVRNCRRAWKGNILNHTDDFADDHDRDYYEAFETPEDRLKRTIIKFGDVVRRS